MTVNEYLMGHPEDILNPHQMYLHDLDEDEERDRLQAGVSSLILDAEDLLDEIEDGDDPQDASLIRMYDSLLQKCDRLLEEGADTDELESLLNEAGRKLEMY